MGQENRIGLAQVDGRLSAVINGQDMSGLFSGYKIMQASPQEEMICLRVKGQCSIAGLSAVVKP